MSRWPLTLAQCGPFITAQCLIWTVSHKTPGSVTQCHFNQDWLELSLAFAFPPSSPLAFFPGRFMNNEWGYMQAGAQILMEQKNRRRTILCAASHCFHTLPKLPLPGQFFFCFFFTFPFRSLFSLSFLLLPAGLDEIILSLSFCLAQRYSLLSWLSQWGQRADSDFEMRKANFQIIKKKRKEKKRQTNWGR